MKQSPNKDFTKEQEQLSEDFDQIGRLLGNFELQIEKVEQSNGSYTLDWYKELDHDLDSLAFSLDRYMRTLKKHNRIHLSCMPGPIEVGLFDRYITRLEKLTKIKWEINLREKVYEALGHSYALIVSLVACAITTLRDSLSPTELEKLKKRISQIYHDWSIGCSESWPRDFSPFLVKAIHSYPPKKLPRVMWDFEGESAELMITFLSQLYSSNNTSNSNKDNSLTCYQLSNELWGAPAEFAKDCIDFLIHRRGYGKRFADCLKILNLLADNVQLHLPKSVMNFAEILNSMNIRESEPEMEHGLRDIYKKYWPIWQQWSHEDPTKLNLNGVSYSNFSSFQKAFLNSCRKLRFRELLSGVKRSSPRLSIPSPRLLIPDRSDEFLLCARNKDNVGNPDNDKSRAEDFYACELINLSEDLGGLQVGCDHELPIGNDGTGGVTFLIPFAFANNIDGARPGQIGYLKAEAQSISCQGPIYHMKIRSLTPKKYIPSFCNHMKESFSLVFCPPTEE